MANFRGGTLSVRRPIHTLFRQIYWPRQIRIGTLLAECSRTCGRRLVEAISQPYLQEVEGEPWVWLRVRYPSPTRPKTWRTEEIFLNALAVLPYPGGGWNARCWLERPTSKEQREWYDQIRNHPWRF